MTCKTLWIKASAKNINVNKKCLEVSCSATVLNETAPPKFILWVSTELLGEVEV